MDLVSLVRVLLVGFLLEVHMRITSKGQVTIPIEIRQQLGLFPHTEVRFVVDGDGVRIVCDEDHEQKRGRRIVDHLRGRGSVQMTTDEIMALTRGET